MKMIRNKGVDLMNMSPTLVDEFIAEVARAYNSIYQEIGQDLSAPGACIDRDELFEICSDRYHDVVACGTIIHETMEKHVIWWLAMTQEQRDLFIKDIFPVEYYEVGDNSGFGPDGEC